MMRACALLLVSFCFVGCAVNLYYPEEIWKEPRVEMRERFGQHWNVITETPELRSSLHTVSGRPLAFDDITVLRISSKQCFYYKIQERFKVWQALQERFPRATFEEIDLGAHVGAGPAA